MSSNKSAPPSEDYFEPDVHNREPSDFKFMALSFHDYVELMTQKVEAITIKIDSLETRLKFIGETVDRLELQ